MSDEKDPRLTVEAAIELIGVKGTVHLIGMQRKEIDTLRADLERMRGERDRWRDEFTKLAEVRDALRDQLAVCVDGLKRLQIEYGGTNVQAIVDEILLLTKVNR